MPVTSTQAPEQVLGVAFAQSFDLVGDALRSVGVSGLIRLSQTHPDLFEAVNDVCHLLITHQSRVLTGVDAAVAAVVQPSRMPR